MVPFVVKYQPARLESWLFGNDMKFPSSERKGAVPEVPRPPSLKDLICFKGDSEAVRSMVMILDPTGNETAKFLPRSDLNFADSRPDEFHPERPTANVNGPLIQEVLHGCRTK